MSLLVTKIQKSAKRMVEVQEFTSEIRTDKIPAQDVKNIISYKSTKIIPTEEGFEFDVVLDNKALKNYPQLIFLKEDKLNNSKYIEFYNYGKLVYKFENGKLINMEESNVKSIEELESFVSVIPTILITKY